MIKRIFISLFIALSLFGSFSILTPLTAEAASSEYCQQESNSFLGFPTWYKFLEPQYSGNECNLTFVEENGVLESLPRILLAVFEIVLRVAGIAAVAFVIYGGIRYILSQGEPEGTKNAKNTILNSLIGLAIVMSATAIVNLIGSSIT